MKNHFIFKLIAVLFCTASLLGIVGSGLGIFALTETGLYTKSVDQMLEERIQGEGSYLARNTAARYASLNLGGMPEEPVWHRFPNHGGFLNTYGYTLKDAQGNVLDSSELSNVTNTYTYPISGQYIHLVSTFREPTSIFPETVNADDYAIYSEDGLTRLYSAIPPEGTTVSGVVFGCTDGHVFDIQDGSDSIAAVHYGSNGEIVILFTSPGLGLPHSTKTINYVHLLDSNFNLIYEAAHPNIVGTLSYTANGSPMFVSTLIPVETVEETTPPETVPETVPETAPETVPEETVPETVPETTAPEIEFTLEDNIPDGNKVEVTRLIFELEDGTDFDYTDEQGIGRIQRNDDGTVKFTSYEFIEAVSGIVTAREITFMDADGETILMAESPEGIGTLYHDEKDRLFFQSEFPVPVVEETVPEETVAETIPETIPPTEETLPPETVPAETIEEIPAVTRPTVINGKPLYEYEISKTSYTDPETGTRMYAEFVYLPMPEYTFELYLNEDSLSNSQFYDILRTVRNFRQYLLPILGMCVIFFLLSAIYLCTAAGRKPKSDEVRAGGLNRIPLDLYFGGGCFLIIPLILGACEGSMYLMGQSTALGIACAAACGFGACLLVVGFLFAFVAQCRTPGGFWYRNTLCAHCIRLFYRFALWLQDRCEETIFPFLGRLLKKTWSRILVFLIFAYRFTEKAFLWIAAVTSRFFRWFGAKLHRFLCLLPLTWQWLLVGTLVVILIFATEGHAISFIVGLCVILYASHCFGLLAESTRRMSKGDLDAKVDDKLMVGCFQEFADDLNALAGVAVIAAQKQLKSERMKSELITNVSHDIKTPLTSIINYVDLLQKPHTEEEGQQYLEVLNRQSLQLKKLIDDLMDMSKANTGNMAVDIGFVDAVESVNQALGEFADKLDKAHITPVFRHTESSVPMMADGKLVWRVLSNLLTNAVKYAMPYTRLYVDLSQADGKVIISLKNISREELNLDGSELMERFVRGDDSRNTEGSGLGLNIAKSLMELQKGQLELLVDGDLFKVTLIFPGA